MLNERRPLSFLRGVYGSTISLILVDKTSSYWGNCNLILKIFWGDYINQLVRVLNSWVSDCHKRCFASSFKTP